MDLLSCREISGDDYMAANVQFKCYTTEYYYYLFLFVIPSLAFFMFVIPVLLFLALRNKYKNGTLTSIAVRFKYGFLYSEYTTEAYFWEFIKITLKMLIISLISFY